MSSARTTKRKQLKGQTVLGDFFPKPNKPSKSLSSTVKKKFDVKLPSSGTESKSKIEERKEEKTPSTVVSKKTDKIGKKRSDLSSDKEAGEEKRSSLKRKVTGAGMFSFSWTRGSQRDTEQYRNGYPDKEDDPDLTDNFSFYMNKIPSKPDGDYIDKIHVDWWGDYRRLEVHHGYIQWLFPIRESGLNWHAQELQLHEIEKLMKNKKAMKRILTSYKMMLNFYGMKLDNEDDGTIVREENWKNRFIHLNRSYHNYLRITRILKCLGEFGYEHLKKNFVKFVLHEGLAEGTLSNVIESCVKYWIGVLKDDEEREEMFDYYEKLMQDDGLQSKRRNRSPSPPSYWPNKDDDSKINKKQVSKKGRDKKDKVDGDVENEFSDDETVSYAMSLIDEDLPEERNSKNRMTRKEHEISDSDNDDNIEESQEMSHWNEEKKANAEEIEGGSECDDSVPGRVVKTSVDNENEAPTNDKSQEDIEEQNIDDNTEPNGDSRVVNEESESGKEKDVVCSENHENKDEDSAGVNVNEKGETTDAFDENCNGNNGLKSEKDIDLHISDNEEMDTTEPINNASSESDSKNNVEENSIESKESEENKPNEDSEIKEEENMETENH